MEPILDPRITASRLAWLGSARMSCRIRWRYCQSGEMRSTLQGLPAARLSTRGGEAGEPARRRAGGGARVAASPPAPPRGLLVTLALETHAVVHTIQERAGQDVIIGRLEPSSLGCRLAVIPERLLDLLLRLLDGHRLPRLVRPARSAGACVGTICGRPPTGRPRRFHRLVSVGFGAPILCLFPARFLQGKEDDLTHVLLSLGRVSVDEPVDDGANLGRGQPPGYAPDDLTKGRAEHRRRASPHERVGDDPPFECPRHVHGPLLRREALVVVPGDGRGFPGGQDDACERHVPVRLPHDLLLHGRRSARRLVYNGRMADSFGELE